MTGQLVDGLKEFIRDFNVRTRLVQGAEHLVLYKAVRNDYGSWYLWANLGRTDDKGAYLSGNTVRCRQWDENRHNSCSAGLHVGTQSYAEAFKHTFGPGMRVIRLLVRPEDVVCVPYGNGIEGYIRCRRLVVDHEVAR